MGNITEVWTPEMYQQHKLKKAKKKKAKVRWPSLPVSRAIQNDDDKRDKISEIIFPFRLPGMNDHNGIIRMYPRQRSEFKTKLEKVVQAALYEGKAFRHTPPVRIELVRHSIGRSMDYDNLVSTGKYPIDALVTMGLIPDDKETVVVEQTYKQTKALKRINQYTLIRIIDLPLPV